MKNYLQPKKHRRFHFAVFLTGSVGLFAVCLLSLIISLANYTSDDVIAYKKLVLGAEEDSEEKNYVSTQERLKLQKDLLLSEKDGRLELRLVSAHSELALDQYAGEATIVEKMKHITCHMQEEVMPILSDNVNGAISKPMQVIRQIEAETATYYYKEDVLIAHNVKVRRYLANGYTLHDATDSQPIMEGTAESVSFTLKGKERNFKVNHLKATFYPRSL